MFGFVGVVGNDAGCDEMMQGVMMTLLYPKIHRMYFVFC